MISHTTKGFWKLYEALPAQIQRQAKMAYRRFQNDPSHPSLQFKQVHEVKPIFSLCALAVIIPPLVLKMRKKLFGFGLDHIRITIIFCRACNQQT